MGCFFKLLKKKKKVIHRWLSVLEERPDLWGEKSRGCENRADVCLTELLKGHTMPRLLEGGFLRSGPTANCQFGAELRGGSLTSVEAPLHQIKCQRARNIEEAGFSARGGVSMSDTVRKRLVGTSSTPRGTHI